MIKNILIVCFLITSTLYAELKQKNKNLQYKVSGTVFKVNKYISHTRVSVNNKDGKKVVLSLKSNRNVKENNMIYGTCHKKKNGKYMKCYVTVKK